MRRVVLRVDADAVEDALDTLLCALPDGVQERLGADGTVELVAHALTAPLPSHDHLRALAVPGLLSLDESTVPDDWRERRRLDADGGVAIDERIWLRCPLDPEARPGLLDVVIERSTAFGTGAHPTTRMCLSLLTGLTAGRAFADLGCGAGALAIAAAKLGFAPVHAVDHDEASVAAAQSNASLNGVTIDASACDLMSTPPPPARVVAANVPPAVHAALAGRLAPEVEVVFASGFRPGQGADVIACYAAQNLQVGERREEDDWVALSLRRGGGAGGG